MPTPDSRTFRQTLGCFATGVTVVTTTSGAGEPAGITINSFTSVSLEPALVLFCLERKAHVWPIFRDAQYFAVNILSEEQEALSRHFSHAARHPLNIEKIWKDSAAGCPLIKGTLGWLACKKSTVYSGGDHDIFIGEVVDLHKTTSNRKPLLYVHGRYRTMKD